MNDRDILKAVAAWNARVDRPTTPVEDDMWKALNKLCRSRPGWKFFTNDDGFPCWYRGNHFATITYPMYEIWISNKDEFTTEEVSSFNVYSVEDVEFFLNATEPAEAGPVTTFDRASVESALLLADDLLTKVEGLMRPEDYLRWKTLRALAGVPIP